MELIVNVAEDWGIGCGNEMLVALKGDLRFFRRNTMGKTVILGRKTLSTFPGGKPLEGRRNLVLSSNQQFTADGAEVVHSLEELRTVLKPGEVVSVIGGESIYRLLLPYVETAYVTKTEIKLPADRFFPNLDCLPAWKCVAEGELQEEGGICYRFCEYRNMLPQTL